MRATISFGPVTLSLILAAAASGCGSQFESETPDPPSGTVPVRLQEIASGLAFPLYLTSPPGDTERLFILERAGTIRIVKAGALLPTPFLDISGQVSTSGEQGLLGLAFTPDYASSGRFVIHYTDPAGNTVVSRFRVSGDPDLADATSEEVLLRAEQPFSNHNGGQIAFGPDGLLYIGLGDGGGSNDPGGRGQSLADLLGSILRIDATGDATSIVPPDNPFVGMAEARPEIWSYGLRNPWRFSFDPATGDLYIADVGQNAWEEVNVALASEGTDRAANYGWNRMEGRHCFQATSCDQTGLVLPVFEYDHGSGCSITGGYVYRGAAIPAIQGHYFYSDYCAGWVRSFRLAGTSVEAGTDWPTLRPGGQVVSLGQDAAGELYLLIAEGRVFKIVPQ